MKDKKSKKIVLIISILILLILLAIIAFDLFKHSIMNKPYIVLQKVDYSSIADMVGQNSKKYFNYYINENGYIVESNTILPGKEKNSLIRKISQEEVKELEQYIINEVERINNESGGVTINSPTPSSIWLNGTVVSNDENLINNLIKQITE